MANSPVPPYQTFASQVPEIRQVGSFETTGPLSTSSSIEYVAATIEAAGSDQATAAVLPNSGMVIVTGADGTNGVSLIQTGAGGNKVVELYNSSSDVLLVYPPVGGTLNNAVTPRSIAGYSGLRFLSTGQNSWGCVSESAIGMAASRSAGATLQAGTWVFDGTGLYIHDGETAGGKIVHASGTDEPSTPGLFPGAIYRKLDANGNLVLVRNWTGEAWE